MARGHSKGVVGGAGRLAGIGLSVLKEKDRQAWNQRIASRQKVARERRLALVAAIGRLSFKRGTTYVDVSTEDRREGLELLCKQQGWTVTYQGDKAIVQKVSRATFVHTTSEPLPAA